MTFRYHLESFLYHSAYGFAVSVDYSVSQKTSPTFFSCNFRKHCRIFIMFGIHVTEKVSNQ